MLSTVSEVNDAIAFIEKENTNYPGAFSGTMNVNLFNSSMAAVEEQLDELYEKTRYLEELSDFTEAYVKKLLEEKKIKYREILKIIEDTSDCFVDAYAVAVPVPFRSSGDIVRDRNGEVLNEMPVCDSSLCAMSNVLNTARIRDITVRRNNPCYLDTYNTGTGGWGGISYYQVNSSPAEGGITEELTVKLERACKCNFIRIIPSNCDVTECRLINTEGILEAEVAPNTYFDWKEITGARIKIVSANYSKKPLAVSELGYDTSETFAADPCSAVLDTDSFVQDVERARNAVEEKYNAGLVAALAEETLNYNGSTIARNTKAVEDM